MMHRIFQFVVCVSLCFSSTAFGFFNFFNQNQNSEPAPPGSGSGNNRMDMCGASWNYGGKDICVEAMKKYPQLSWDFRCCVDSHSYNGKCFPTGWTKGWDRMVAACEPAGYWKNVQKKNYGSPVSSYPMESTNASISFQIHEDGNMASEISEDCDVIQPRPRPPFNFNTNFNSPFIYFEGLEEGAYQVSLDSEFDSYKPDPEFTIENGWGVSVNNNQLSINNEVIDHLFYELDLGGVTLNRNGQNFDSKESLLSFLEEVLLADLGMSEQAQQNSLEYTETSLDDVPDANNYYLTVLSDESVDSLSTITVTHEGQDVPVKRVYYAVYPTRVPISGIEPLQVQPLETSNSVLEFGEVIIQPDMEVFWE